MYTIPPLAHLRIERAAEAEGLEVIGVVHSHTHTDAYPSPTDVAQAARPGLALRHRVACATRPRCCAATASSTAPIAEEQVVVDG